MKKELILRLLLLSIGNNAYSMTAEEEITGQPQQDRPQIPSFCLTIYTPVQWQYQRTVREDHLINATITSILEPHIVFDTLNNPNGWWWKKEDRDAAKKSCNYSLQAHDQQKTIIPSEKFGHTWAHFDALLKKTCTFTLIYNAYTSDQNQKKIQKTSNTQSLVDMPLNATLAQAQQNGPFTTYQLVYNKPSTTEK